MSNAINWNGREGEHIDVLIAVALNVNEALGRMCCDDARRDFIHDLFDRHDVVWCLWHDAGIVRALTVKEGDVDETAIMVPGREYAETMRDTIGDGAPAITHNMPSAVM